MRGKRINIFLILIRKCVQKLMHFTGFIFIFVFIKNISCPNPKSLIYNFSVENFLFTIQYSTL